MPFVVLTDYLISFILQKSIFFYIIGFCAIYVLANHKPLKEKLKYYIFYLIIYEVAVALIHIIQIYSRL